MMIKIIKTLTFYFYNVNKKINTKQEEIFENDNLHINHHLRSCDFFFFSFYTNMSF